MTSNPSPGTPGLPRVPTAIPGLDEVIGGGFLKSGVYMVQGTPGAGKTILANQISFTLAAAGKPVVYVTMLAESHARLMQHMSAFSFFDESLVPEPVYYVSAFNALRNGGLPGVVNLLRGEMRTHKAQLLVLDGLVMAANAAASDESLKLFISDIQAHSTLTGCTTLLLASDDADRPVSAEHTMVDGILSLRECRLGPRRERTLDVVKFRGSSTLRGAHSFRIGASGITVYPRLESARRDSPDAAIKSCGLSTGIAGLDHLIEIGGYPQGSVTVLSGYSGSGKTSIGLHFLARATADEPGLFFGFYESPEFLLQISRSLGVDLQPLVDAGVLHFVWQPYGENLLDELAARLLESIRHTGAKRVFIDGLGGFAAATAYEARDGGFLASLANELRRSGATSLITAENTSAERSSFPLSTPTMSALCDNIIRLDVQIERSVQHRMWIGKVRNSRYDLRVRDLVLTATGLEVVDCATSVDSTTAKDRTNE
ncbi:ATPase domain-containing protein [Azohydromonas lata]|uniref:non-specific serine/threonine protein kinase n=1 Tax=Azohydromonas lata TaxID=45677 RepID=A0ABU5IQB9_9BURK|nr:ATPase domain-containing protein [Azohydromonas lata]MDZ5461097.1 ATPase domain-containing protein [Azohydromonas lata]